MSAEKYALEEDTEAYSQPARPLALGDNAHKLLRYVLEANKLVETGLDQQQVSSFFESEVFPAHAALRQSRNETIVRGNKFTPNELQEIVERRQAEMRLYLGGMAFGEVAERRGIAETTARTNVFRELRKLARSRYDGAYFTERLLERYPDAVVLSRIVRLEQITGIPTVTKRDRSNQRSRSTTPEQQADVIGFREDEATAPTPQPSPTTRTPKGKLKSTDTTDSVSYRLDDSEDEKKATVHTAGATADPVKDYLKQIGKTPLINAEIEVDLSKRIEAGLYAEQKLSRGDKLSPKLQEELEWIAEDGRLAKNLFLESNLRLVVSLAKRYTGRGMMFMDLIQEGNLGLIRAVEKFDYTKGYKFSTYATWWVRQAITRAMADQARAIRIPVHVVEVVNKLARVERQMVLDLGREPTVEELAKEMDVTAEKIVELRKYNREPISLNTPLGEDGDSELGDLIEDGDAVAPADAAEYTIMQEQLRSVLDTLDEREAGIMKMRYGLDNGTPKTLEEIGDVYGVTRERIRQIESRTNAKLQHPSRSGRLRGLLD